jgi:hypothetical protein
MLEPMRGRSQQGSGHSRIRGERIQRMPDLLLAHTTWHWQRVRGRSTERQPGTCFSRPLCICCRFPPLWIVNSATLRWTLSPLRNVPLDSHSSTVYPHVVVLMRRAWTPSRAPENTPTMVPTSGFFLTHVSALSQKCTAC